MQATPPQEIWRLNIAGRFVYAKGEDTVKFIIEQLSQEQLAEPAALIKRVFMEFEAPEYSQEGIASFLDYIEPGNMAEKMKAEQLRLWGAFRGDALAGVIALRPPCAVSLLFVEKKYHRRGIGRALFQHAVNEYCSSGDIITVNSSPYAVEAYRRLGFRESGPEQEVTGIRFVPMYRPASQK